MSRTSRNAEKRSYKEERGTDDENSSGSEGLPSKRARKQSVAPDHDDSNDEDDDNEMESGSSYETGQILKVHVENFMNHRKFTQSLGRHLNFITGRNGSGKSAIAAAIQLCLGMTATKTGRGKDVAGYIREGSPGPAICEVTLLNEGPDAHEPEAYGPRIIVRRMIFKNASSTYQLLSAEGKEVSRQKDALTRILMNFNVHVDTPCCILTQEESKRLIHGSPKEKYDFFIRATGLQDLQRTMDAARTATDEATKSKEIAIPDMLRKKKTMKVDRERLDRFTALSSIEDSINLAEAKKLWLVVESGKSVLQLAEDELTEKTGDVVEAEEAMQGVGGEADQAKVDAIEARMNELTAVGEQVGQNLTDKKASLQAVKRRQQTLANQKHGMENSKRDFVARTKVARTELKTLMDRAMQDADQEERVVRAQLQEISNDMDILKDQDVANHSEKQAAYSEKNSLQTEMSRLTQNTGRLQRRITETNNDIKNLTNGSAGTASRFGNRAQDVLRKIEQYRSRFHGPVLGPVGTCITIKDGCDMWATAVERLLGALYGSFVVQDVRDRNTLYAILKEVGGSAARDHQIIYQKLSPRFNVQTPNMRGVDVLTIADVINVSDDNIFNAIADQASMYRVGLQENEASIINNFVHRVQGKEALMYELSSMISANGTVVSFKGGNQSSEVQRRPFKNLLTKDSAGAIATLRVELQQNEQELHEHQGEIRSTQEDIAAADKRMRSIEGRHKSSGLSFRSLDKRKADVEARLLEVQEAGRFDSSHLVQEIEELVGAQRELDGNLESMQARIEDANGEVQAATAEKNAADSEKSKIFEQYKAAEQSLTVLMGSRDNAKRQREGLERDLEKKQTLQAKAEQSLRAAEAQQEEQFSAAKLYSGEYVKDWDGSPIPLTRQDTERSLQKEVQKFMKQREVGLQEAQLEGYDAAILTQRYSSSKAVYADAKIAHANLVDKIADLDALFLSKQERFKDATARCVKVSRHWFDKYQQMNNSAGTIKFSHSTRELFLKVMVDNQDKNTISDDVRNLSGGERSFVTLCLLLALGHVVENPFRVMDEYDVFMDEGRRNTTLEMIKNHSQIQGQSRRQIIVITPNNLNSVKADPKVKIIRLADPLKNASHGLQQQTI
mmetsp:Transcript_23439/g.52607  ORF Transcript_23439/g.52607 Transcript_23439/m.52607 type:complete len:1129 (-) Transcript_23439:385-3771(-)